MAAPKQLKRMAAPAVGLAMLGSLAAPFIGPAQAAPASFADPAFTQLWNRSDKPVDAAIVNRSWMWGPDGFYTAYEPYLQGPGGQHLVEYFDKSRMEINNPAGDRSSEWFVTNGLLVVDMVSGRVQSGDQQFTPASPANLPVAGDADTYADTPVYASLARVASLHGDNRAPTRTGQSVQEGLGRGGNVAILGNLAQYSKYAVYEPTLGHNIPDVFWSFLNEQGPVFQNGQYVNGPLMNWVYVMGYPITEPYWIRIKAGGQERWVLMQAFQRRILTYSPFNSVGWKVEMGNVGRAYYDWRYRTPAPPPTATPVPVSYASITLDPSRGDATAPVTVSGRGFPAFSAVSILAKQSSTGYSRNLYTVGAGADGTFSVRVNIPLEAAKLGELTIAATANGGTVRATQQYVTKAIFTDVSEVVSNGNLHVYAVGQPAGQSVRIGVELNDNPNAITWVSRVTAAGDRTFNTTINIRSVAVGSTIRIIGEAPDGYRVQTAPLRVIAQPNLSVTPSSGPVNTTVTLRGTLWQPNRNLVVGLRSVDGKSDVWLSGRFTSDAAGNISFHITIGREYAGVKQVRLLTADPVSGVRVETLYTVTR